MTWARRRLIGAVDVVLMITSRPLKRIWCALFHRDDTFIKSRLWFRDHPGYECWVDYVAWVCRTCGCATRTYFPRYDLAVKCPSCGTVATARCGYCDFCCGHARGICAKK